MPRAGTTGVTERHKKTTDTKAVGENAFTTEAREIIREATITRTITEILEETTEGELSILMRETEMITGNSGETETGGKNMIDAQTGEAMEWLTADPRIAARLEEDTRKWSTRGGITMNVNSTGENALTGQTIVWHQKDLADLLIPDQQMTGLGQEEVRMNSMKTGAPGVTKIENLRENGLTEAKENGMTEIEIPRENGMTGAEIRRDNGMTGREKNGLAGTEENGQIGTEENGVSGTENLTDSGVTETEKRRDNGMTETEENGQIVAGENGQIGTEESGVTVTENPKESALQRTNTETLTNVRISSNTAAKGQRETGTTGCRMITVLISQEVPSPQTGEMIVVNDSRLADLEAETVPRGAAARVIGTSVTRTRARTQTGLCMLLLLEMVCCELLTHCATDEVITSKDSKPDKREREGVH